MTNQKKLKNYLLGINSNDGYLNSSLSDGKVIMLSGKWGSGKTHFWQNEIQKVLNNKEEKISNEKQENLDKKENKIANHYISLYGKTSIEEIKNEIFLKVFESVDSFESEEKKQKTVKDVTQTAISLSKSISVFGISLDLSKLADKSFEKLEDILKNEKLKRTENYLNRGAIICFDDFERKSKDIDLNDLFGFITQLTLNFKCKVVIIVNDDVFKGKEKEIFSNVKEKTVSKYLYYSPSIKELFETIFNNENYKKLDKYKNDILKSFEETKQLNARIYEQVLNNLLEWLAKYINLELKEVRCFILVNVYFIRYHLLFEFEEKKDDPNWVLPLNITNNDNFTVNMLNKLNLFILQKKNFNKKNELLDILKQLSKKDEKNSFKEQEEFKYIKINSGLIWAFWELEVILNFRTEISSEKLKEINEFIKTGII